VPFDELAVDVFFDVEHPAASAVVSASIAITHRLVAIRIE
jgi:hypothetical protein